MKLSDVLYTLIFCSTDKRDKDIITGVNLNGEFWNFRSVYSAIFPRASTTKIASLIFCFILLTVIPYTQALVNNLFQWLCLLLAIIFQYFSLILVFNFYL